MAKERVTVQMKDQVKELYSRGYSLRAIERMLPISFKTIKKILGQNSPPSADPKTGDLSWAKQVNWDLIRDEVNRRGTSIKQLHIEHAPGIAYLTFWRTFRQLSPVVPEVSMRLIHKPGERTQIDFTDGIPVVDRLSGSVSKTHLLTGVLGFSSKIYAEFVTDQKIPTFIATQEKMWHYFGGVTPYVVIDNLKSGVTNADLYDPDLNPTYVDYANHAGFAVLPARPRKPRDKAKNEASNNVIQRDFFQRVRNKTFYSLAELNAELFAYLDEINNNVMKDYGVSRNDRFAEEQPLLKPLPPHRFEISEWRTAKVHPDCHIQVIKNFYSVPYNFVGRTVRVRLSSRLVEVFGDEANQITCHARIEGKGKFSTVQAHYPEQKVSVACFQISQAKHEARLIGEHTTALIEELTKGQYPLKHLRRIQGILRLYQYGGIAKDSLEYAAKQAMSLNRLRLAYIKSCALYHQHNGARPTAISAPKRNMSEVHLQHNNNN